jgi:bifunctional UDP-N-acetylglucosamine pyrophosphorylase / glucosamine-1-phosphate N-acetyltransferase|uniref:bifunctional UDP-N-acetylglucosamine diphosphorylase/glucosamine-1-phosphate N-acetyltransferase GlmU n=1 Tax=Orrella sp. TaxID=1921583 RepID=UPI0040487682
MLNIVILAAGMGKRMQSDRPKVLHTIAGQPMLFHLLITARALNPDRLIVVVGHGQDQIKAALADQPDILFADQTPQLGTGHAVMQAADQLFAGDGSTLVLYGDVPLVQVTTLQALLAASDGGLALLTETLTDPTGYGRIVRDDSGHVVAIVEEKDANEALRSIQEVNTGMLVASTPALKRWLGQINNQNAQGEYYLTDIIGLAAQDKVEINTVAPQFAFETQGVNSRSQQASLERQWQNELARQQLAAGVALADPQRFDVRGTLACGRDVFIDVGCVFEGQVVLGNNVVIEPHCVIRNATIGDGTIVKAYSHVEQAQVGAQVQIGPYARLRPGTVLADQVHVGNFVEIKNSVIGHSSKANHLAYVGDADVGQGVNIGAGTITCNYDGVNKHRTVIEDDAFIGSDTQLVAPVRVGKGATLGAGTTLTQDAPPHKLTVSRTAQTTLESWQRPTKKTK